MVNKQSFEQIAQENSTMAEIGRIISSSLDINEVYPAFAEQVQTLIRFDQLDITVIDRESKQDEVAFSTALLTTPEGITGSSPLEGSITGIVASSLNGLIVQGISPTEVDSRYPCLESSVRAGFRSWIAVPLIARDAAIGALFLHSCNEKAFSQLDLELAGRIANQISGAMANARLYEERKRAEEMERRKSEQLGAMFAVARILARSGSFASKITNVMQELAKTADGELATIRVPDEQQGGLRRVDGAGPGNLERSGPHVMIYGDNLPTIAFREEQAVIVNDYVNHPLATQQGIDRGVKSLLSVPVKAGGNTLGVVSISALEYNHFTPDRVTLLTAIINGLGTLLFNSQLAQSLESSREEMAAADEVARVITSTLDIEEVYEQFASEVKMLMDVDQIRISIIDEGQNSLHLPYVALNPSVSFDLQETVPLEGTISGQIAKSRETIIIDDLAQDTRFWTAPRLVEDGLRSTIVVPLISKDKIIGTLVVLSAEADAYGTREKIIVERLAAQIAPSIDNSLLFQRMERLSLALESIGEGVAFLDLDEKFKYVNRAFQDLYGYDVKEILNNSGTIIVPDDEENQAAARRVWLEGNTSGWRGEAKRVRKNGQEIDTFITLTPLKNRDGEVIGRIGVVRDITESKRAEEAERLRSAQLSVMFEVASILARPASFESKITNVMEELAKTADGEVAIFRVPDDQQGGLRRVDGAGPGNLERSGPHVMIYGDNLPTVAFREEQAVIANDYVNHPLATQLSIDRGVKSLLSVPVKADGSTLGVVSITALEYNHFTPDRVRLLTAIIDGLGSLLVSSNLAQDLESAREEMAAVDEVARIFTSNLDIDQVYEQFAAKARF